jgi:tRNA(Met) C34 N-acetyltransferase TmcA
VPELLSNEDLVTLGKLRNQIEALLFKILPLDAEPPDPSLEDAELVNIVAQNLEMPEATRQDLLERPNVLERARALVELLAIK